MGEPFTKGDKAGQSGVVGEPFTKGDKVEWIGADTYFAPISFGDVATVAAMPLESFEGADTFIFRMDDGTEWWGCINDWQRHEVL